jgi:hypothetical protein
MVAWLCWTPFAEAKHRPAPPPPKKEARLPPPGDKRTNEGAQGRMNATGDAARWGEAPLDFRR